MSTEQERFAEAGSSTDQYVDRKPETETGPVDEEPDADTPAHGSSNLGVNTTGANRPDGAPPEDATMDR